MWQMCSIITSATSNWAIGYFDEYDIEIEKDLLFIKN